MPTRSPYPVTGTMRIIYQRLKDGTLWVNLSTGNVYSVKNGVYKELTQFETKGYFFVAIHKRCRYRGKFTDRRKGITVHRLVWIAANGPIPRGRKIHHKDTCTAHNWIENLECVTDKKHYKIHHELRNGNNGEKEF